MEDHPSMILDWHADFEEARHWDVLDAETGECLNALKIWYADDSTGVIRRYRTDERGMIYIDKAIGRPAWVEERRPIRLVPKAPR